ncbi:hypothetical protein [Desulfobacterium sp. N47]|uniref:Uncharacterized protein n=1 Tax=uncultured Desulfobacterium sp. TaxID=201089 RepID=E1Y8T2_9BACT|nr:unknown protein [uncultured Desulfobacterium sp.]
MALQVKHSQLDIKINDFDSDSRVCMKINPNSEEIIEFNKKHKTRYLKISTSLIGEDSPFLSDFSANFADKNQSLYRYDWIFGLSCLPVEGKNTFWDWKAALRDNNSLKIQFLFDLNKSNLCANDLSAHLLCLYPSKDISSWFDKHSKSISSGLDSLAETTEDYSKTASDVFRISNILTNFISSDDNGKNWYLYRFLDQNSGALGLEWHITKKVIDQFGPLLRGSLIVSFHGQTNKDQKNDTIKLAVRPELGFNEQDDMCYVSPHYNIKEEQFIDIKPKQK